MPPRLARLLAVLVAAALVAGAFVVRGALADDDEGTVTAGAGGRGDEGDGGDGGDGGPYRVLCDDDLGEAACAALEDLPDVAEVEVLTAGEAIAAARDGAALPWDLWLTLDPLPGVLDTARAEEDLGPVTSGAVPVASAPLALLTFEDSPLACAEPIEWACLVEPVRPEVAIPSAATALGVVAIAAGATGLAGGVDFGIGAYEGTEAADDLSELIDGSPAAAGSATAEQTEALFNPGTAAAAVTIEGLGARRAATTRGRERGFRAAAFTGEVVVGVVLAGLGSAGEEAVAALEAAVSEQTVLDALADGGWTGGPTTTSGLPEADLVFALQEELG